MVIDLRRILRFRKAQNPSPGVIHPKPENFYQADIQLLYLDIYFAMVVQFQQWRDKCLP